VKGRKRQIAVDTQGGLLRAAVHAANVSDQVGVWHVLYRLPVWPRWQTLVVDAGYATEANAARCRAMFGVEYQVVQRLGSDFTPQPKRWVVERTFAWLGKDRRLSKDYEFLPGVSEAFLYLASLHLLARRLVRLAANC
jgi:putative transposase